MEDEKSKFNTVKIYNKDIDGYEELDGFYIINIKRDKKAICRKCGEEFTKKKPKQIFCSRECVSKYKTKVKATFGNMKEFKKWLDEDIVNESDFN